MTNRAVEISPLTLAKFTGILYLVVFIQSGALSPESARSLTESRP